MNPFNSIAALALKSGEWEVQLLLANGMPYDNLLDCLLQAQRIVLVLQEQGKAKDLQQKQEAEANAEAEATSEEVSVEAEVVALTEEA